MWRKFPGLTAIAFALISCRAERAPQQIADTTGVLRPVVTETQVNTGTYGMFSQVRWAFPPNRAGVLVVVDAVGVEAEMVPDGFLFALEEPTFTLQVDSVWDVAPRPDWGAVAYSRAYVVGFGESEVVPPAHWEAVSRATGIDTTTLRVSSFSTTGMAYARGIAHPRMVQVPQDPRAEGGAQLQPRAFPIARGWRLRWSADGSLLGLGSNPQMVQDDEQSASWTALDPGSGAVSSALPGGTRLVEPEWVTGPHLGYGLELNVTDAPPITVRSRGLNYVIESRRGIITIRDPAFQTQTPVPVGPGVALAASGSGRYIVALRPRANVAEYDIPVEVVVYTVVL